MNGRDMAARLLVPLVVWTGLSGLALHPSLVPRDEILSGGPPKDGIPALTDPETESAREAGRWLRPSDTVLGVVISGQARAYPLRILNWHEIVNDRIGDRRFVVTYCPLCGSGMLFDSSDIFGVSGLLYQSDVLLYDRKTESLWSQLMARAVTGPRIGERLKMLPAEHTTWRDWHRRHPQSRVLSRRTGYSRDYEHDPYAFYRRRAGTMFPVRNADQRLHAKAWVIGLSLHGHARAWDIAALARVGELREHWQGRRLIIRYHADGNRAEVLDATTGRPLPAVSLYWFAWAAFHPDTELYH